LNTYLYGSANPINNIDPLGLYWFRQSWQTPGVVGRENTIVEPGGTTSEIVEKYVPAGYTFGQLHDAFVGSATKQGYQDKYVNIPSMFTLFVASQYVELLRSIGVLEQPQSPNEAASWSL